MRRSLRRTAPWGRIPVRCIRYEGMIHGFLVHAAAIDVARQALDDTAAALKKAFAQ